MDKKREREEEKKRTCQVECILTLYILIIIRKEVINIKKQKLLIKFRECQFRGKKIVQGLEQF